MNAVYTANDYRNYLQHHGILGMRWGHLNGPPYPLDPEDHSAAERRAGWRQSLDDRGGRTMRGGSGVSGNAYGLISAPAYHKQRAEAAEKAKATREAKKREEEERAAHEKAKEDAIKSGKASEIAKYSSEIKDEDFQRILTRIDNMNSLNAKLKAEMQAEEAERKAASEARWEKATEFFNKVDKVRGFAEKGINAWNVIAKVNNSLNPNTKLLTIDISNDAKYTIKNKLEDARKAAEAQAKATHDAQEAKRAKEVQDAIRSGDPDKIKAKSQLMTEKELEQAKTRLDDLKNLSSYDKKAFDSKSFEPKETIRDATKTAKDTTVNAAKAVKNTAEKAAKAYNDNKAKKEADRQSKIQNEVNERVKAREDVKNYSRQSQDLYNKAEDAQRRAIELGSNKNRNASQEKAYQDALKERDAYSRAQAEAQKQTFKATNRANPHQESTIEKASNTVKNWLTPQSKKNEAEINRRVSDEVDRKSLDEALNLISQFEKKKKKK